MERNKRGCLTVNGKPFYVYDGLNTIGRDKQATVIVKDLGVSHQQAILTIVDETRHFISDFNSSNGTHINNEKLVPYKLYEIKDGSVIFFSVDVEATYKKISENELSSLEEQAQLHDSQLDDSCFLENTQMFTFEENVSNPKYVIPIDGIGFNSVTNQHPANLSVNDSLLLCKPDSGINVEIINPDSDRKCNAPTATYNDNIPHMNLTDSTTAENVKCTTEISSTLKTVQQELSVNENSNEINDNGIKVSASIQTLNLTQKTSPSHENTKETSIECNPVKDGTSVLEEASIVGNSLQLKISPSDVQNENVVALENPSLSCDSEIISESTFSLIKNKSEKEEIISSSKTSDTSELINDNINNSNTADASASIDIDEYNSNIPKLFDKLALTDKTELSTNNENNSKYTTPDDYNSSSVEKSQKLESIIPQDSSKKTKYGVESNIIPSPSGIMPEQKGQSTTNIQVVHSMSKDANIIDLNKIDNANAQTTSLQESAELTNGSSSTNNIKTDIVLHEPIHLTNKNTAIQNIDYCKDTTQKLGCSNVLYRYFVDVEEDKVNEPAFIIPDDKPVLNKDHSPEIATKSGTQNRDIGDIHVEPTELLPQPELMSNLVKNDDDDGQVGNLKKSDDKDLPTQLTTNLSNVSESSTNYEMNVKPLNINDINAPKGKDEIQDIPHETEPDISNQSMQDLLKPNEVIVSDISQVSDSHKEIIHSAGEELKEPKESLLKELSKSDSKKIQDTPTETLAKSNYYDTENVSNICDISTDGSSNAEGNIHLENIPSIKEFRDISETDSEKLKDEIPTQTLPNTVKLQDNLTDSSSNDINISPTQTTARTETSGLEEVIVMEDLITQQPSNSVCVLESGSVKDSKLLEPSKELECVKTDSGSKLEVILSINENSVGNSQGDNNYSPTGDSIKCNDTRDLEETQIDLSTKVDLKMSQNKAISSGEPPGDESELTIDPSCNDLQNTVVEGVQIDSRSIERLIDFDAVDKSNVTSPNESRNFYPEIPNVDNGNALHEEVSDVKFETDTNDLPKVVKLHAPVDVILQSNDIIKTPENIDDTIVSEGSLSKISGTNISLDIDTCQTISGEYVCSNTTSEMFISAEENNPTPKSQSKIIYSSPLNFDIQAMSSSPQNYDDQIGDECSQSDVNEKSIFNNDSDLEQNFPKESFVEDILTLNLSIESETITDIATLENKDIQIRDNIGDTGNEKSLIIDHIKSPQIEEIQVEEIHPSTSMINENAERIIGGDIEKQPFKNEKCESENYVCDADATSGNIILSQNILENKTVSETSNNVELQTQICTIEENKVGSDSKFNRFDSAVGNEGELEKAGVITPKDEYKLITNSSDSDISKIYHLDIPQVYSHTAENDEFVEGTNTSSEIISESIDDSDRNIKKHDISVVSNINCVENLEVSNKYNKSPLNTDYMDKSKSNVNSDKTTLETDIGTVDQQTQLEMRNIADQDQKVLKEDNSMDHNIEESNGNTDSEHLTVKKHADNEVIDLTYDVEFTENRTTEVIDLTLDAEITESLEDPEVVDLTYDIENINILDNVEVASQRSRSVVILDIDNSVILSNVDADKELEDGSNLIELATSDEIAHASVEPLGKTSLNRNIHDVGSDQVTHITLESCKDSNTVRNPLFSLNTHNLDRSAPVSKGTSSENITSDELYSNATLVTSDIQDDDTLSTHKNDIISLSQSGDKINLDASIDPPDEEFNKTATGSEVEWTPHSVKPADTQSSYTADVVSLNSCNEANSDKSSSILPESVDDIHLTDSVDHSVEDTSGTLVIASNNETSLVDDSTESIEMKGEINLDNVTEFSLECSNKANFASSADVTSKTNIEDLSDKDTCVELEQRDEMNLDKTASVTLDFCSETDEEKTIELDNGISVLHGHSEKGKLNETPLTEFEVLSGDNSVSNQKLEDATAIPASDSQIEHKDKAQVSKVTQTLDECNTKIISPIASVSQDVAHGNENLQLFLHKPIDKIIFDKNDPASSKPCDETNLDRITPVPLKSNSQGDSDNITHISSKPDEVNSSKMDATRLEYLAQCTSEMLQEGQEVNPNATVIVALATCEEVTDNIPEFSSDLGKVINVSEECSLAIITESCNDTSEHTSLLQDKEVNSPKTALAENSDVTTVCLLDSRNDYYASPSIESRTETDICNTSLKSSDNIHPGTISNVVQESLIEDSSNKDSFLSQHDNEESTHLCSESSCETNANRNIIVPLKSNDETNESLYKCNTDIISEESECQSRSDVDTSILLKQEGECNSARITSDSIESSDEAARISNEMSANIVTTEKNFDINEAPLNNVTDVPSESLLNEDTDVESYENSKLDKTDLSTVSHDLSDPSSLANVTITNSQTDDTSASPQHDDKVNLDDASDVSALVSLESSHVSDEPSTTDNQEGVALCDVGDEAGLVRTKLQNSIDKTAQMFQKISSDTDLENIAHESLDTPNSSKTTSVTSEPMIDIPSDIVTSVIQLGDEAGFGKTAIALLDTCSEVNTEEIVPILLEVRTAAVLHKDALQSSENIMKTSLNVATLTKDTSISHQGGVESEVKPELSSFESHDEVNSKRCTDQQRGQTNLPESMKEPCLNNDVQISPKKETNEHKIDCSEVNTQSCVNVSAESNDENHIPLQQVNEDNLEITGDIKLISPVACSSLGDTPTLAELKDNANNLEEISHVESTVNKDLAVSVEHAISNITQHVSHEDIDDSPAKEVIFSSLDTGIDHNSDGTSDSLTSDRAAALNEATVSIDSQIGRVSNESGIVSSEKIKSDVTGLVLSNLEEVTTDLIESSCQDKLITLDSGGKAITEDDTSISLQHDVEVNEDITAGRSLESSEGCHDNVNYVSIEPFNEDQNAPKPTFIALNISDEINLDGRKSPMNIEGKVVKSAQTLQKISANIGLENIHHESDGSLDKLNTSTTIITSKSNIDIDAVPSVFQPEDETSLGKADVVLLDSCSEPISERTLIEIELSNVVDSQRVSNIELQAIALDITESCTGSSAQVSSKNSDERNSDTEVNTQSVCLASSDKCNSKKIAPVPLELIDDSSSDNTTRLLSKPSNDDISDEMPLVLLKSHEEAAIDEDTSICTEYSADADVPPKCDDEVTSKFSLDNVNYISPGISTEVIPIITSQVPIKCYGDTTGDDSSSRELINEIPVDNIIHASLEGNSNQISPLTMRSTDTNIESSSCLQFPNEGKKVKSAPILMESIDETSTENINDKSPEASGEGMPNITLVTQTVAVVDEELILKRSAIVSLESKEEVTMDNVLNVSQKTGIDAQTDGDEIILHKESLIYTASHDKSILGKTVCESFDSNVEVSLNKDSQISLCAGKSETTAPAPLKSLHGTVPGESLPIYPEPRDDCNSYKTDLVPESSDKSSLDNIIQESRDDCNADKSDLVPESSNKSSLDNVIKESLESASVSLKSHFEAAYNDDTEVYIQPLNAASSDIITKVSLERVDESDLNNDIKSLPEIGKEEISLKSPNKVIPVTVATDEVSLISGDVASLDSGTQAEADSKVDLRPLEIAEIEKLGSVSLESVNESEASLEASIESGNEGNSNIIDPVPLKLLEEVNSDEETSITLPVLVTLESLPEAASNDNVQLYIPSLDEENSDMIAPISSESIDESDLGNSIKTSLETSNEGISNIIPLAPLVLLEEVTSDEVTLINIEPVAMSLVDVTQISQELAPVSLECIKSLDKNIKRSADASNEENSNIIPLTSSPLPEEVTSDKVIHISEESVHISHESDNAASLDDDTQGSHELAPVSLESIESDLDKNIKGSDDASNKENSNIIPLTSSALPEEVPSDKVIHISEESVHISHESANAASLDDDAQISDELAPVSLESIVESDLDKSIKGSPDTGNEEHSNIITPAPSVLLEEVTSDEVTHISVEPVHVSHKSANVTSLENDTQILHELPSVSLESVDESDPDKIIKSSPGTGNENNSIIISPIPLNYLEEVTSGGVEPVLVLLESAPILLESVDESDLDKDIVQIPNETNSNIIPIIPLKSLEEVTPIEVEHVQVSEQSADAASIDNGNQLSNEPENAHLKSHTQVSNDVNHKPLVVENSIVPISPECIDKPPLYNIAKDSLDSGNEGNSDIVHLIPLESLTEVTSDIVESVHISIESVDADNITETNVEQDTHCKSDASDKISTISLQYESPLDNQVSVSLSEEGNSERIPLALLKSIKATSNIPEQCDESNSGQTTFVSVESRDAISDEKSQHIEHCDEASSDKTVINTPEYIDEPSLVNISLASSESNSVGISDALKSHDVVTSFEDPNVLEDKAHLDETSDISTINKEDISHSSLDNEDNLNLTTVVPLKTHSDTSNEGNSANPGICDVSNSDETVSLISNNSLLLKDAAQNLIDPSNEGKSDTNSLIPLQSTSETTLDNMATLIEDTPVNLADSDELNSDKTVNTSKPVPNISLGLCDQGLSETKTLIESNCHNVDSNVDLEANSIITDEAPAGVSCVDNSIKDSVSPSCSNSNIDIVSSESSAHDCLDKGNCGSGDEQLEGTCVLPKPGRTEVSSVDTDALNKVPPLLVESVQEEPNSDITTNVSLETYNASSSNEGISSESISDEPNLNRTSLSSSKIEETSDGLTLVTFGNEDQLDKVSLKPGFNSKESDDSTIIQGTVMRNENDNLLPDSKKTVEKVEEQNVDVSLKPGFTSTVVDDAAIAEGTAMVIESDYVLLDCKEKVEVQNVDVQITSDTISDKCNQSVNISKGNEKTDQTDTANVQHNALSLIRNAYYDSESEDDDTETLDTKRVSDTLLETQVESSTEILGVSTSEILPNTVVNSDKNLSSSNISNESGSSSFIHSENNTDDMSTSSNVLKMCSIVSKDPSNLDAETQHLENSDKIIKSINPLISESETAKSIENSSKDVSTTAKDDSPGEISEKNNSSCGSKDSNIATTNVSQLCAENCALLSDSDNIPNSEAVVSIEIDSENFSNTMGDIQTDSNELPSQHALNDKDITETDTCKNQNKTKNLEFAIESKKVTSNDANSDSSNLESIVSKNTATLPTEYIIDSTNTGSLKVEETSIGEVSKLIEKDEHCVGDIVTKSTVALHYRQSTPLCTAAAGESIGVAKSTQISSDLNDSTSNSTLQNTQMDDNFYAASTQIFNDTNFCTNKSKNHPQTNKGNSECTIPDDGFDFAMVNTQNIQEESKCNIPNTGSKEQNIHDLPTQLVSSETSSESTQENQFDLHDLPTQLIDSKSCSEVSSENTQLNPVDLYNMPTQLIMPPDKFKSAQQMEEIEFVVDKNLSIYDAPTQVIPSKSNKPGDEDQDISINKNDINKGINDKPGTSGNFDLPGNTDIKNQGCVVNPTTNEDSTDTEVNDSTVEIKELSQNTHENDDDHTKQENHNNIESKDENTADSNKNKLEINEDSTDSDKTQVEPNGENSTNPINNESNISLEDTGNESDEFLTSNTKASQTKKDASQSELSKTATNSNDIQSSSSGDDDKVDQIEQIDSPKEAIHISDDSTELKDSDCASQLHTNLLKRKAQNKIVSDDESSNDSVNFLTVAHSTIIDSDPQSQLPMHLLKKRATNRLNSNDINSNEKIDQVKSINTDPNELIQSKNVESDAATDLGDKCPTTNIKPINESDSQTDIETIQSPKHSPNKVTNKSEDSSQSLKFNQDSDPQSHLQVNLLKNKSRSRVIGDEGSSSSDFEEGANKAKRMKQLKSRKKRTMLANDSETNRKYSNTKSSDVGKESDSDTDTEPEKTKKHDKPSTSDEKHSIIIPGSDSNTDIEENGSHDVPSIVDLTDIEDSFVKRRSFMDVSSEVIPATQEMVDTSRVSFSKGLSTILDVTCESNIKDNTCSETSFRLGLTQDEEEIKNNDIYVVESLDDNSADSFDFAGPTQKVDAATSSNLNKDDEDFDFAAPTQKMSCDISPSCSNQPKAAIANSETLFSAATEKIIEEDDEIFDTTTQKLDNDVFKRPFQRRSILKTSLRHENSFQQTGRNFNNPDLDDSDLFIAATQVIHPVIKQQERSQQNEDNLDDSDVFIAATQKVVTDAPNTKNNDDSDIFYVATQKMDDRTESSEGDDISSKADKSTKMDDTIFSLATQKMDAVESDEARSPITSIKSKNISTKPIEDEEESIFLDETQVSATNENITAIRNISTQDTVTVADSNSFNLEHDEPKKAIQLDESTSTVQADERKKKVSFGKVRDIEDNKNVKLNENSDGIESQMAVMFASQSILLAEPSKSNLPLEEPSKDCSTQDVIDTLTTEGKEIHTETKIGLPRRSRRNSKVLEELNDPAEKASKPVKIKSRKLSTDEKSAILQSSGPSLKSIPESIQDDVKQPLSEKKSKLSTIKIGIDEKEDDIDIGPLDCGLAKESNAPEAHCSTSAGDEEKKEEHSLKEPDSVVENKRPTRGNRKKKFDTLDEEFISLPLKKRLMTSDSSPIRDSDTKSDEDRKEAEKPTGRKRASRKKEETADVKPTRTRATRGNKRGTTGNRVEHSAQQSSTSGNETESVVGLNKEKDLKKTKRGNRGSRKRKSSDSDDDYLISITVPKKQKNITISDDSGDDKRQPQTEPSTKRGRKTMAESVSTSLLSTPERAKRKFKTKVVFTMFESTELSSLVRTLGGVMVDTIDESTVLVTKHVLRSLKLLCAIGQCKPICSPDWLQECKKSHTFLDPWDFLIVDEEAEKKWNFSLKESYNKSKCRKLFEGYSFLVLATKAVDVIKASIESCGGKCVSKAPKAGNFIVVATEENRGKCAKYFKQNVRVVFPEAIFDGVLRQDIVFEKHLLT